MAIYELLNDYISKTQPVVNSSYFFVLLKIIFQSVPACMVICMAVKRRSTYERVLLSAAPMVFAITYAFMDVMLGGSFLGGGFHHTEALYSFLCQPHFLKDAVIVLIIFPILSILIRKWTGGFKTIILIPGDITRLGLYIVSLLGTLYFAMENFSPLPVSIGEREVIRYAYSILSISCEAALDIMAVVWRIMFKERSDSQNLGVIEGDDRKCKKCIAKLLLRGHRVFLFSMIPLLAIIAVVIILDARKNGTDPMTIAILIILCIPVLCVGIRMMFPSTLSAMRRMESWDNPQVHRREFCREYFDEEKPPYMIQDIAFTEHYVIMPGTIRPFIFYFPDECGAKTWKEKAKMLIDGSAVGEVNGIAPKDVTVLRGMLDKVRKSELKKNKYQ